MSFEYVPCVKSTKERCFGSIFPTFSLWQHAASDLGNVISLLRMPKLRQKRFFKQSLWNIDYSGRSEFLFPRRCLIFLQFLRVWFNSVDSHFFVPILKVPVFGPKKVRENLRPFKQYFHLQTSQFQLREVTTW